MKKDIKDWEEYGWAILGEYGLYIGWWMTRKEAIESHTKELGRDWEYCKCKGDKAVKIRIYPV